MEIFLCDRIILTGNAKYLLSYPQRVMNDTKNSDHPTNPEYTSTDPITNPITNHLQKMSTRTSPTQNIPLPNSTQSNKNIQAQPPKLYLSSRLLISISNKKCPFTPLNTPRANPSWLDIYSLNFPVLQIFSRIV